MQEAEKTQALRTIVGADLLTEHVESEIDLVELMYCLPGRWKFVFVSVLLCTILSICLDVVRYDTTIMRLQLSFTF